MSKIKLTAYHTLLLWFTVCAGNNLPHRTCTDLFYYHNIKASGTYLLDVDGKNGSIRPFWVECDMADGQDLHSIRTIMHHDTEDPKQVRGREGPGSYVRNVSYNGVKEQQLQALVDNSFSCQQFIKWECKGATFSYWFKARNWWVGRNWTDQYYWGGAETDSKTCGCFPNCQPTVKNSTCNCDANFKLTWLEDSGLLLDKTRLPVLQLRFGDTGETNEAGQYTLGPLICRTNSHKLVFSGSFVAPIAIKSPGFPENYPPPFYKYTWNIKILKNNIVELVFPTYEVVHYGAYNSVPGCKSVIDLVIYKLVNRSPVDIQTIARTRSSPPYFISDGEETHVNLTFTTCNQHTPHPPEKQVRDEIKGFHAEFRHAKCKSCNAGFGRNSTITRCEVSLTNCATIASFGYPFPYHLYESQDDYSHVWLLTASKGLAVELTFNDFDLIDTPGSYSCDQDVLSVYRRNDSTGLEQLVGKYCNLNKLSIGRFLSRTTVVLYLKQKFRRVGNGRGIQATVRALVPPAVKEENIYNAAVGKFAEQSEDKNEVSAHFAVDGNTENKKGSLCSSTSTHKEPWWRVNLQKRHRVYSVEIHNLDDSKASKSPARWPPGLFGLPMPVSGCPKATDFAWKTGVRFHDVAYEPVMDDKFRYWSPGTLLKGGSTNGGIEQHFCIKDQYTNSSRNKKNVSENERDEWMPGSYCIFQVGESCPELFQSGAIIWADKMPNATNSRGFTKGALPRGIYTNKNTTINFCCREDGHPDVPIRLPTELPFYLLQYGDKCQEVDGMTETSQFFHYEEDVLFPGLHFDSIHMGNNQLKFQEPHPKVDTALFDKGVTLYYCYYDITKSLRGFKILVDSSPSTYGYDTYHEDKTGISRGVEAPFLNAVECASYPVESENFNIMRFNCAFPIDGQYVIIYMKDRFDALRLCEVKVFASESCGASLGMATEEIHDSSISATSGDESGLSHYHSNARLNNLQAWCASITDSEKFITIDLKPMQQKYVVGIVAQGLKHFYKDYYVTTFKLQFSNNSVDWHSEENPIGKEKVYTCTQCQSHRYNADEAVVYFLLKPILARYVRLKVVEYQNLPCLRMEILGCVSQEEPCVYNLLAQRGNITSPNYPNYYGQDKTCTWHVPSKKGNSFELDFQVFDLATMSVESGKCEDIVRIQTSNHNLDVTADKLFPKKFISNGSLTLELKSCYRDTLSRFRGFHATYKAVKCPGCGVGYSTCPKVHECQSTCGRIISINYPLNYRNNHRCRWLITAPSEHYVNLTIEEFDVPSKVGASQQKSRDCMFDHVTFIDNHNQNLIGRYCNSNRPPRHIVSSWNQLLIEFNTDSDLTGRGFSFRYQAQKFQLRKELSSLLISPFNACPVSWSFYKGHCYKAFFDKPLQWYEAEKECASHGQNRSGHLVSLLDKNEAAVVHHLLINVWKAPPNKSFYIGLIDVYKEGAYRWSDNNPMSYTDWAPKGTAALSNGEAQPDGGAYEDCTILKFDSGHSTANWHDIPCSLGKHGLHSNGTNDLSADVISSYICKMKSSIVMKKHTEPLLQNMSNPDSKLATLMEARERYFVCDNKEVVSVLERCNGMAACTDRSDEKSGCPPPRSNYCLPSQFRCSNGRCISIGSYCDFSIDCTDGSDEAHCERRTCESGTEFKCTSGECIPISKRCDLLTDCKDGSDEGTPCSAGGVCNTEKTFQCYHGICIPKYAVCDRHRDCPGKFHEDEQSSRCDVSINNPRTRFEQVVQMWTETEKSPIKKSKRRATCLDLYLYHGVNESGDYYIEPQRNIFPLNVECLFSFANNQSSSPRTVIHHDSEVDIYVKSTQDGPATYNRTIVYDVPIDGIIALINRSLRCRQFLKWECSGSGFNFNSTKPISWWESWDGTPQYYWGGATVNNTCACWPHCIDLRFSCNCDAETRFQWQEDSGNITDKAKLPIRSLVFGETFETGQAGKHYVGPLECTGNSNYTDEEEAVRHEEEEQLVMPLNSFFKCQSGQMINTSLRCIYEIDQYGYQRGCRDVTHLRDCEKHECDRDYVKCPDAYCIPPRYICDGKWDCVGGDDEKNCEHYSCPGRYKCRNTTSCILLHKLCDNVIHCPHGDDEWFCDMTCPKRCNCMGLYVSCQKANLTRLPGEIFKSVRKLDLSNNLLGPDLATVNFSAYQDLGELILQRNSIVILKKEKFVRLVNLYRLDLRYNKIKEIESGAFLGLSRVVGLLLHHNPELTTLEQTAFDGLSSLENLNISFANIQKLNRRTFAGLTSLNTLQLKGNNIEEIEAEAFSGLDSLLKLDLTENNIRTVTREVFSGLKNLEYLKTDSFKFCCLAASLLPKERCWPLPDEISDCEDLMSSPIQRSFLWILGTTALVCNLSVIIWRCRTRLYTNSISSTLILSLGCSDFLMGIYLIIIASVDVYYRGRYIEVSDNWRKSGLCKFCGFLSTISSEASVFTLVFITIDRLVCICFPFSKHRFSLSFTYKLIASSWIAAFTMSIVPLVIKPYFKDEFYSRSGVCLALHITNQNPAGWEYSVAIFLVINLIAFLVIAGCYSYMYNTIKQSSRRMTRIMARQVRERQVGRQMAFIVMSNFLCWMPIIIMGLMAISGYTLPATVYSWTAVFILPLNSATNPVIYTLAHFRPALFSNKDDSMTKLMLTKTTSNPSASKSDARARRYKAPHGYVPLIQFLRDHESLRTKHLLQISWSLSEQIKEIHATGHALGGINFDNVFVSSLVDSQILKVYLPDFNAYRVTDSGEGDDYAVDMEEFGLLVKRMLRYYHMRKKLANSECSSTC